jgi:hypothetical protein
MEKLRHRGYHVTCPRDQPSVSSQRCVPALCPALWRMGTGSQHLVGVLISHLQWTKMRLREVFCFCF